MRRSKIPGLNSLKSETLSPGIPIVCLLSRMADWLKKQAEREAEKEQRQVERLQRKLREPEHRFSDMEFQQQCHELSERLEDSVIKGRCWSALNPLVASPVPLSKCWLHFRSAGVL